MQRPGRTKYLLPLLTVLLAAARVQAQTEQDCYAIAQLALDRVHAKSLLDSAYTLDVTDCLPGIVELLQLSTADTRLLHNSSKTGFRWQRGKLRPTGITPVSEMKMPPYRNWVALTKPVFFDARRALIQVDTPGGGETLFLRKTAHGWQIARTPCVYYY